MSKFKCLRSFWKRPREKDISINCETHDAEYGIAKYRTSRLSVNDVATIYCINDFLNAVN